jgi:hypothetical protein
VTVAVFEYLRTLRSNALQDLEFNAGKDALNDRFTAGLLAGINEVLNMTAEDVTQAEESQEDDY